MTGLALALASAGGALALGAPAAPTAHDTVTTVRVRLTDTRIVAVPERVPAGLVVFRIANRGTAARSFAVGPKRGPTIAAGRSATLRVRLAAKAAHDLVSVGPRGAPLSAAFAVFEPCGEPTATTVEVHMAQDDGGITFSRTTIPCGTVTFVVTDVGTMRDRLQVFADYADARGSTPELEPGQTARLTLRLSEKGLVYYQSGDHPPGEPEFGGGDGEGGRLVVV